MNEGLTPRIVFAWAGRLALGVLCGMSYVGALLTVGWAARLTQVYVLRAWWRRSGRAGGFAGFLADLGPDAPAERPNWLWRERPGQPGGPLAALFANLHMGLVQLAGTFLLAGWGTALMTCSYLFAWEVSFHKVYELRQVGPLTALAGWGLFAVAMMYVPMAQAHAAVTGELRSFFDFRLVVQLIRARLTDYVILAALFLQLGLFQEGIKSAAYYLDGFLPSWTQASDRELLWWFRTYYLCYSAFLLFAVLTTRLMAGGIYARALLRALRRGWVTPDMLPARPRDWLGRLGLLTPLSGGKFPTCPPRPKASWKLAATALRALAMPALFLLWLAFAAKTYVGEFINYHPVIGFLNQPLVMLPYADHTPRHLAAGGADEGGGAAGARAGDPSP